ncbi:hypothetical protein M1145_02450 [Patescibacteria group bacterium]|nr:hypothetical protein [Patescibacteria group bacterium]
MNKNEKPIDLRYVTRKGTSRYSLHTLRYFAIILFVLWILIFPIIWGLDMLVGWGLGWFIGIVLLCILLVLNRMYRNLGGPLACHRDKFGNPVLVMGGFPVFPWGRWKQVYIDIPASTSDIGSA